MSFYLVIGKLDENLTTLKEVHGYLLRRSRQLLCPPR